jgi:hypothetical protein
MVQQDYKVNQNFWVGHKDSEKGGQVTGAVPAIDPLLGQGICMSLCYSWAEKCLKGEHLALGDFFDKEGPEWQRRLSFQRAYDLTWYDTGRQQPYAGFKQTLEKATTTFLSQNGNRDGMNISKILDSDSQGDCKNIINALKSGKVYNLLIAGDNNPSEQHGIWAHVVGISYPDALLTWPIFFDPNQGQFSWQPGAKTVGADITNNLVQVYETTYHLKIRDYVMYEFAKK